MPHPSPAPSAQTGVTLVGMLVSLAVVGILASQAVPAMSDLRERQQLRAVAEQLQNDIIELRQQVTLEQRNLHLHVEAACYFTHDGTAEGCRCDRAQQRLICPSPDQLLNLRKLQWTPVTLDATTADIVFSAQRNTVGMATVRLVSAHYELWEKIAITGRVRSCAARGGFSGMKTCEPS